MAPTPEDLVATIAPLVQKTGYTILVEPGRSIVGNAGMFPQNSLHRNTI